MNHDIERVLLTEEQLHSRIAELARQLSEEYRGRRPVCIGILKGCIFFVTDIVRQMDIDLTLDFMALSSYGSGSVSQGKVRVVKDLEVDIAGRDVLILEDIIDSGNTLLQLKQMLATRHPSNVRIVTLLDKPSRRTVPLSADLCGFTVPDEFLVGYGLDYAERYRNLPYIGVLKRAVYEK